MFTPSFINPKPQTNRDNPIWDNVENATNFLVLSSTNASNLPEIIVKRPATNIKDCILDTVDKSPYIINTTTPAVTSVLLWTKAEVGVGADIALGNHPLNGTIALLVKQKKPKVITLNSLLINDTDLEDTPNITPERVINKNKSPNRIVIIVTIALLCPSQE
jgi:hypothetical protein